MKTDPLLPSPLSHIPTSVGRANDSFRKHQTNKRTNKNALLFHIKSIIIHTGDKNDIDGIDTPSTSLIKSLPPDDDTFELQTSITSRRRLLSSRISEINKEFLIDNDPILDTL